MGLFRLIPVPDMRTSGVSLANFTRAVVVRSHSDSCVWQLDEYWVKGE